MKQILLMIAVVALVGCGKKENPPRPAVPRMLPEYHSVEEGVTDAYREVNAVWEEAMDEWYNSLVVCLHCGSDLAAKGAKVCAGCGREQRD